MSVIVRSASIGPNVVTDGLVLYLDAANTKSYPGTGTVWYDLSGNGYGGNLEGGLTYTNNPDKFNTNVTDVTTDNRLSTSSQITFADTSEYTFDFFIKLRSSAQSTYHSLTGRGSTHPWLSITPTNTTGQLWNIRYRQSDGVYINSSNINYDIQNNWANIVLSVKSNRNVDIYLNSNYIETISPTSTLFYVNRLGGGYYSSNSYYCLQGYISTCRLYNKSLTTQEILQNFNATKNRYGL